MLLQAKGIDVNNDVSIMILNPTISPPHLTIANIHHYWCGMSVLFSPTESTCQGLILWSHRGSDLVVTGRGD